MKRLIAVILVLCIAVAAGAAAEEDDIGSYLDWHPEAGAYVSAWVAENGDWRTEVFDEDGGLKMMIVHRLGDNKEDVWEYAASMGENAEFDISEEGKLVWKDLKEDAGKGLAFEKIGSFYGGRWMKGDIEVIFFDWYDGQYDIRLYQRGSGNEILKDAILKGDYDPKTDTLTAEGEFEGEEPFTVTFSYDENRSIVWTENGESTVLEYSFLTD